MTVYKIRDKETGLYSDGGRWPKFSKKGKTWKEIGHVKLHISQFNDNWKWRDNDYLSKIEVVAFDVQEIVTGERVVLL